MKGKKNTGRTEKNKMAVLTAECDRMFCVDKEQIQLFKKIEKNQKSREKADIAVSKISKQIIVESTTDSDDNT
ncbi:MAG: hypothetical protein IJZ24_03285 [Clostridia bacterium]|nr:hypothetical protein [Clostridia bacterium]